MRPSRRLCNIDAVKDILALYGIQGDVLGRPEIYSYNCYDIPEGYSDWPSYATALINAGVPEDAIRMETESAWFGINWCPIPEDKTLEEFYDILTASSGNLKFPVDKLEVRLPVKNSELIPRSPYKAAVITDKDCLRENYDNCFVKIFADTSSGGYIKSRPIYVYAGDSGSGDYDWLMQKSDTDNYLLVSSDAPVYVHTLVTQQPYETCKNWSVDEWEYFKENYNDKYFDFDSTDHFPRRYTIPLDSISSGSSYIVIAHFADNHVETSKVFVKP